MTEADRVFVVGTSEGGIAALRALLDELPATFQAAILIVLHIGAHKSNLPWLLRQSIKMSVSHPLDGERVNAGHVYIAPPDNHMIVTGRRIGLTKGPRENWVRPAVDPLFRSAAEAYGRDVVGVILTGGLNDGTAGMYEIKQHGGITVVQTPADCVNPSMPQSALNHVTVDHCLPVADMPKLFEKLGHAAPRRARQHQHTPVEEKIDLAAEFTTHRPVAMTCPDCGGALRETTLGTISQYTCHIGHVYTAEVMLAAQFISLERALETAMRALGERAELCQQMATRTVDTPSLSNSWTAAVQEALAQKEPIEAVLTRTWTHPTSQKTNS